MALQKMMSFYNEKGNVSVSTRSGIKNQVSKKLKVMLEKHFSNGVVLGKDGAFYMPLALTHKDEIIYGRIDLTISVKDPNAEKTSKSKTDTEIELD